MKKTVLGLAVIASVSLAATNEELQKEIQDIKKEIQEMKSSQKKTNETLLEEILNVSMGLGVKYESFSSLGLAASKIYHANETLSIGGYGEYKFKKYSGFKNYGTSTANETRNKAEYNIVRFVPYIGFKFNDWIIMNTEIEFENGGARSDNTKNYKYVIVEFSYLDFLINKEFAVRVGHILVPFGLVNLNHEPVAFLTSDRPTVETFIIPSTWHTNGLLTHGQVNSLEYYAGIVTSPDAGSFREGRFIQQGRTGARQFTDDLSFVARTTYNFFDGLNAGASFMYGTSSVATEVRPGVPTGQNSDVKITTVMAEIHATYIKNGFNIQTLATYGSFSDDVEQLSSDIGEDISKRVYGAYVTAGYDLLHTFSTKHKLYAVGEIEYLNMDASDSTKNPDNNKFSEYTIGFTYFPDPKVIIKGGYKLRDYASGAKLADEDSFTLSAGFIF